MADSEEAIRLDPNLALAYLNRGLIFEAKGDWERAKADWDTAIRLDPKDGRPYIDRATYFLYKKGDVDKATADTEEAIRLCPKLPAAQ